MYTPAIKNLIQDLVAIPERQLEGELRAADRIEAFLQAEGIAYSTESYETSIPRYLAWSLTVDGEDVPCLPCGLESGVIDSKATILASTISSQKNLYDTNINFNPYSTTISRSNFYFAPALAIARGDLAQVVNGRSISGSLEVEKQAHTAKNFLIGNQDNPKSIIFTHYDSVSTGAIDNASGTALTLDLVQQEPHLLDSHLFVVCGNEEISYDETIYWGHGYRAFETAHPEWLEQAEQLVILDSLGHTAPQTITDVPTMTLAFPVRSINVWASKTKVIAGDLGALMEYYHAENDRFDNLRPEFYQQTFELARQVLQP